MAFRLFFFLVALLLPLRAARGQVAPPTAPHPYAYGVLVGSNRAGAGQKPLRYAEQDARRVADVFKELGNFRDADLRVLAQPDGAAVLHAIDEVARKLAEHQRRGEQAVFVFYYSGHARANAFTLGAEELPIATVRERLQQLPTTLTLIVLDACQSGKFVRVKGAEPAADFTFNSVSRLATKGTAVMASSSAEELSQESDDIRSSYFTHHLVVGLRGAADTDKDGRVSLDEAYRYAYRKTLTATSETQVGSQHVTLETDLAGQGDVPVTYPAAARSHLELPGPLEGRILVEHRPSGSVVAEVQKVAGSPIRLALVAGRYAIVVRRARDVLRCDASLLEHRVTALVLDGCAAVRPVGAPKGAMRDEVSALVDPAPNPALEPWSIEGAAGFMARNEDGYTDRLREFGYARPTVYGLFDASFGLPRGRFSGGVFKGIAPYVSLGGEISSLGGNRFTRATGVDNDLSRAFGATGPHDEFEYHAYGASAAVRAMAYLVRGRRSYLSAFAQLNAGATLGLTSLTLVDGDTESETHWGFLVGAHGGLLVQTGGAFGIFARGGYDYAPTIRNLIGDTHDVGGPAGQLGVRVRID